MIAVLLAAQLLGPSPQSTVVYDDVPGEVVRIQLSEWQGSRPGAATIADRAPGGVKLTGSPHRIYVVLFARADGSYLLDGPFPWPAVESRRAVPPGWYRTVRGDVADESATAGTVDWISGNDRPSSWPMCFPSIPRGWSCWGVRPETAGVVVWAGASGIHWTLVATGAPAPMRRAAWGRLMMVTDAGAGAAKVHVTLARPVAPPANRVSDVRLSTAPIAGARAMPVTHGTIWVVADEVPPKAWVEVATKTGGPVYLDVEDVAGASASVPLHIALPARRVVAGRVLGNAGQSAPLTLVATFRLIEAPPTDGRREVPRRVLAAETVADAEGRFEIDGVGQADYEIVAWHSQLGRVSVPLPSAGTEVVVRLQSAGIARGRVLAGGRPVEGIDVISVPDAAAFTSAPDITAVKGGDGRTGPDGRFSVIVADSGGGELRIGGGTHAVTRVALPRPPLPVFDVGDVNLATSLSVTVVLDHDPRCVVRAAGPVGRSGLHVVIGQRTADGGYAFMLPEPGLWEFTLGCVGERRTLSPGAVEIGAAHAGKELRLVVR